MDNTTREGDPTGVGTEGESVEERLGRVLTEGSEAADRLHGVPVADPDALGRRIRRRAGRRATFAAVAAAVMLVAAGGGGYLAGRTAADGHGSPIAATKARSSTSAPFEAAAEPIGGAVAVPSTIVGGPIADHAMIGSGGVGPAEPLFQRRLADGTVLDVRTFGFGDDPYAGGDRSWKPPRWCFPIGGYYVGVRAPDAVGQAGGDRYGEVRRGSLVVAPSVVGVPERAPRWVLVVQAPVDVVSVRATFPGGGDDSFAVVGATAVLSVRAAASLGEDPMVGTATPDELIVEGLDQSGAVVARWSGDRWGSAGGVATTDVPPSPSPGDEPTGADPTTGSGLGSGASEPSVGSPPVGIDPSCQPPSPPETTVPVNPENPDTPVTPARPEPGAVEPVPAPLVGPVPGR